MALKTKSRSVGSRYTLDCSVEKGLVSTSQIRGETLFFNGEAMILTRDFYSAGFDLLDRMVSTTMSALHFFGFGTKC